jgi:hypothetical protein
MRKEGYIVGLRVFEGIGGGGTPRRRDAKIGRGGRILNAE